MAQLSLRAAMTWLGFALVLTVVFTSPAHAQVVNRQPANLVDPSKTSITQYKIDDWQTERRLPLNTMQTIYQTRAGYLWMGTAAGLARFDDILFATFEGFPVPELVAPDIRLYGRSRRQSLDRQR